MFVFVLADEHSDNSIAVLKNHYIKDLEFQCIDAQFRDGKKRSERKRNEIHVDLAIVDTPLVEREWMNCDRQYHLRTYNQEKSYIDYKDVLKETDESVLLRGIAGIGKTNMLDYLILQWAQNAIWNGEDNQPDSYCVFRFNGREINRFQKELSVKDLFKRQYPFVPFELIQCRPERIVLIFDGLDEFKDIEAFCEPSCYICNEEEKGKIGDILHFAFDRNRGCFPGHKSILAGRPEAINTVFSYCGKGGLIVKRVDIVGFSKGNIEKYIKNFADGDEELKETLDKKIRESDNLGVMSHVPVYLWIICSIFQYDRQIPAPRTITELYIWILGIYLREHFKGSDHDKEIRSIPLPNLFKVKEIQNLLFNVSKFSYEISTCGKVVFTQDEMTKAGLPGNLFDNSEKHGFIVKVKDDTDGIIYQFRHLTLQEFFVALECFRRERHELSVLMRNDLRNSEVPPILAGLLGGCDIHCDSPPIIKNFVKAVGVNTDQNHNLLEHLYGKFFSLKTFDKAIEYLMVYLFCCYEFGSICHKIFQEHVDYILFLLTDHSIHHHQFKHLVHFLKYASKQAKVKQLKLRLTDNNITMHDVKHIIDLLPFVEELSLEPNTSTLTKVWQHLADEIYRRQGTDLKINELKFPLKGNGEILSAVSLCVPFMREFEAVDGFPKTVSDYGFDALIANQIYRLHKCSGFRLETLDLAGCNLTDQQQAVLVKCFRFIRKIILDYNEITFATCQSFSQMISEDTRDGTLRVEEFSLCNCKLKENHFVALAECLPFLKVVNLRGNKDLGLKSCEIIKNSTCIAAKDKTLVLENIDLSLCLLQEDHLIILADCIPHLKIVNLEGNDGRSKFYTAICNKIYKAAKDGTLVTKKLSLYGDHCTTIDGITILSQCLPYVQMFSLGPLRGSNLNWLSELNHSICKSVNDRTLVLEKLKIPGYIGKASISQGYHFFLCIDFLRYVKVVNLGGNRFTVDDCKVVKDTILHAAENSTLALEEFTLSECDLREEHFVILADCIPYLKMVDLSFNAHHGLRGIIAVKENIKGASMNATKFDQSPKLQHLNLCGSIMESGPQLMVLAEALPYIKCVNLGQEQDFFEPHQWNGFIEIFKEGSKLICSSQFVLETIIVPEGCLSGKSIHSVKTAYPNLEINFIPPVRRIESIHYRKFF